MTVMKKSKTKIEPEKTSTAVLLNLTPDVLQEIESLRAVWAKKLGFIPSRTAVCMSCLNAGIAESKK